jgi:hypothetical protein
MRIFIPHIDHRRADFDGSCSGAYRSQQWEGRSQLPREVMNAEVSAIHAKPLGFDGKVNRLQQNIPGRACV